MASILRHPIIHDSTFRFEAMQGRALVYQSYAQPLAKNVTQLYEDYKESVPGAMTNVIGLVRRGLSTDNVLVSSSDDELILWVMQYGLLNFVKQNRKDIPKAIKEKFYKYESDFDTFIEFNNWFIELIKNHTERIFAMQWSKHILNLLSYTKNERYTNERYKYKLPNPDDDSDEEEISNLTVSPIITETTARFEASLGRTRLGSSELLYGHGSQNFAIKVTEIFERYLDYVPGANLRIIDLIRESLEDSTEKLDDVSDDELTIWFIQTGIINVFKSKKVIKLVGKFNQSHERKYYSKKEFFYYVNEWFFQLLREDFEYMTEVVRNFKHPNKYKRLNFINTKESKRKYRMKKNYTEEEDYSSEYVTGERINELQQYLATTYSMTAAEFIHKVDIPTVNLTGDEDELQVVMIPETKVKRKRMPKGSITKKDVEKQRIKNEREIILKQLEDPISYENIFKSSYRRRS